MLRSKAILFVIPLVISIAAFADETVSEDSGSLQTNIKNSGLNNSMEVALPRHIRISIPDVNEDGLYRYICQNEISNLGYAGVYNIESLSDPFEETILYRQHINFDNIHYNYGYRTEELIKATRDFTILGGFMVVIALCSVPGNFTKWDNGAVMSDPAGSYERNITSEPVVDEDPWPMNYIVHPYIGSMYYLVARDAGYGILQSLGYSILMSTVYWEYGLEAIPERPSIQDILATPLVGSLLGEMFYILDNQIQSNGGRILGSYYLGSFCRLLLNPARFIGEKMNAFLDGQPFIDIKSNMIYIVRPASSSGGPLDYYVGFEIFTHIDFNHAM